MDNAPPSQHEPEPHVQRWFNAARARWPRIEWALVNFERHIRGLGQPVGPFGEDVYLAASAGHCNDESWRVIENEIRPVATGYLRKRGNQLEFIDECWSDVVRKMLVDGRPVLVDGDSRRTPNMLNRYYGASTLSSLFVTSARNRAITLSERARSERQRAEREQKNKAESDAFDPAEVATAEDLEEIRARFKRLSTEDQLVLRLHLEGGTLSEVIEVVELKCSVASLSRRISDLKKQIAGRSPAREGAS